MPEMFIRVVGRADEFRVIDLGYFGAVGIGLWQLCQAVRHMEHYGYSTATMLFALWMALFAVGGIIAGYYHLNGEVFKQKRAYFLTVLHGYVIASLGYVLVGFDLIGEETFMPTLGGWELAASVFVVSVMTGYDVRVDRRERELAAMEKERKELATPLSIDVVDKKIAEKGL